MRRNCPHCGADQVVAEEKLATGWVFLKCHHCAAVSPIQGKAALSLILAAEKPLRSAKPNVFEIAEPRVEMTKAALTLPPVPEFLKAEPVLFESEAHTSGPVPILLEEEEAPRERLQEAKALAGRLRPYALPIALAIVCFGSGGYLIRSARLIRQGGWIFSSPRTAQVASDIAPGVAEPVVAQTAPAEQRDSQVAAQQISASQNTAAQASRAPASLPAVASAKAQQASTEDKVEVLANNTVLRAGPGLHYDKVGMVRADLQLLVKGSFDDWIEVRTGSGSKTAWIRSDLVKPLKKVAQQEAQP